MSASVTPSRPSTPRSPLGPRVADDWTEHSGVAGHRSLLRRAESKRQIGDGGGGSDRGSDLPGSPLAIGATKGTGNFFESTPDVKRDIVELHANACGFAARLCPPTPVCASAELGVLRA